MDSTINIQDWNGMLHDPALPGLQVTFQDSILETPPAPSRAALFVYLNAMLHDKPSFDNLRVINFLSVRYREDIPILISDLILASFDVLANTIARNEPSRSRSIVRAYIVNKLPVFIAENYRSLIPEPLTPEQCIRQALGNHNASQSFDDVSEARQDFLFACALHQLLPEAHIKDILGETPLQDLPSQGRYTKEKIVSSITANNGQVEQFVAQLESTEGNSGAIATGLVEIMHSMCTGHDTMTLKSICNALSRRPGAIDILVLFVPAEQLLQPFCTLLNEWPDNEEGGEQQPVYDEFGGILLFVAAVRHRIGLDSDDMGMDDNQTFLHKYFAIGPISKTISELSPHESEVLGLWIKGLYETEEISDELYGASKPGDFYLLLPTLLEQSVRACQSKILSLDKLKGGFEFMLWPSLLPSLVSGLEWFADVLWAVNAETPGLDAILAALTALLKPPKLSQESMQIQPAILHIVAKRIETSLYHVQQKLPSRSDVKSLLSHLSPYTIDDHSQMDEIARQTKAQQGGLINLVRQSVHALVQWSTITASSSEVSPPRFAFNQIRLALHILGAYKLLDTLIDEVQSSNTAEIALDVVATLVLSLRHKKPPNSTSMQSSLPMSIQVLLQIRYNDAGELAKTDLSRSQVYVRVYRRVQALAGEPVVTSHAAPPLIDDLTKDNEIAGHDIDEVIAEVERHGSVAAGAGLLGGDGLDQVMGMA